jgi:hypothetical protein
VKQQTQRPGGISPWALFVFWSATRKDGMRMSGTTQMQPGLITRRSLPFGEGGLAFPQTAAKAARYTTFLIDRAYQLEIDLTLCRINETAISNRRWIAFSAFRFSSSIFHNAPR